MSHRTLVAYGCRLLLAVLCVLMASASVQAEPVSEQEVRAAVQTWVRLVTAEARPDAIVERIEPYESAGETVAYIAHLNEGGFCLAGADFLVLPVYFYSPRGVYDPENSEYRYFLSEIGSRLKAYREAPAGGAGRGGSRVDLSERETYWRSLIAGRMPEGISGFESRTAPSSLVLPLTSRWCQEHPYNDQCPGLPGQPAKVGCNGIATAQIMYYWKWPPAGTGTHGVSYPYRYRFTWDSERLLPPCPAINQMTWLGRLQYSSADSTLQMNGYWDNSVYEGARNIDTLSSYRAALASLWGRMTQIVSTPSVDFGAASYDWGLMQDMHADPSDPGDVEVAKFCKHVAFACNTTFGVWDSRSFFGNDVAGLKDHLRYDPDALFNATATGDALVEDLQWGRPGGLGGSNASGGGHAWVVDGYNTNVSPWQFRMNLGWGGSPVWYTFDTAPFPLTHDMMTQIAPTNVGFVGATSAGDGSPDSPYQDLSAAVDSASDGDILYLKAGSENAFTGTIARPLTLKGFGATIR